MERYNGPFFTEDGFIRAEFLIDGEEVKEFEEGGDSGEEVIVIPSFFNCHTHVGDSVVKEAPTGTIEEVVGPGGIKEKELASADEKELVSSIEDYLRRAAYSGIRHLIDFRENGLKGVKILEEAEERIGEGITVQKMGRPLERTYDEEELRDLVNGADGIGLSSYRDWDEVELEKVAEFLTKRDVPLAIHCSEAVREPIDKVLSLDIHHLVHMLEATDDDLELCAEENIPIVICPRSNMYFGKMPDIPNMLRSETTLCLGTDNAMIGTPDIFREMETAYRIGKLHGEISPKNILMMTTWNPRRTLMEEKKRKDNLLFIEHRGQDPAYEIVTRSSPHDILEVVEFDR